ncbi:MAG TPA: carboxypeptidase regulatory-like domain-containing protein, partial [Thermoplasmatales archaeon]|nr:carboxypeptidase regulatory-like domain-containing protein [Thermoplasmatales archaeon]HEX08640.1 carboxypeptidase regulatory-like domain-containing protein [Thermoplasmatales archaeon]
GFILDKITEEPIKAVKVTLYNNTDNFVEYTDENGYYEIKTSPGTYTIKLEKIDYKSYTDTLQLPEEEVYWYNKSLQPLNIPPRIKIIKPEYGRLYIEDRDVFPFLTGKIFVIGKITISVSAFSEAGIDRVEFRIDNGPKLVDRKPPYEKLWWYSTMGKHTVNIKAYDKYGVSNEISVEIIKIG